MFIGNKIFYIYGMSLLLSGSIPYLMYFFNSQNVFNTISLLSEENQSLGQSLMKDTDEHHVVTLYSVWDYLKNMAEGFSHIKITSVNKPPTSNISGDVPRWWGKAEGDVTQLLAFTNRMQSTDYFHPHSFNQDSNSAVLLFFISNMPFKREQI